MKCIYCLKDKNTSCFSRDHVLPESFGKFKNNFVLHGIVCAECNKFFGDELEINLARDSGEGSIHRYTHGIKKSSENRYVGQGKRIKIKVVSGTFKGAYVYEVYSPDGKKEDVKPLPQVGFLRKDTKRYEYFLLDEIPDAREYDYSTYDLNKSEGIISIACHYPEASEVLKEKGITLPSPGERRMIPVGTFMYQITGTIDRKIQRAIAKIGFNYLAFWITAENGERGREILLSPAFDPIRKYIFSGETDYFPEVNISNNAILIDERGRKERKVGHIITTDWDPKRNSIIAKISLFNWSTYTICLAWGIMLNQDISRGHFFNIRNRHIVELRRD